MKLPRTAGIVFHGHFPWNRGIGKLTQTMHSFGWRVLILSQNKKGAPSFQRLEYAEVLRVPKPHLTRIKKLLYYHYPLNPFWFLYILRIAKREAISLLIVRDLPLALVTGLAAKVLGIPAYYDMREYYPAYVAVTSNRNKSYRLLKSKHLNILFLKLSLPFFARIFVTIPEVKQRLVKFHHDPDKISILRYLPNKPTAVEDPEPTIEMGEGRKTRFVYAGGVEEVRGLDYILKAFALLEKENMPAELTIIAEPSEARVQLENLANELGISNVVFKNLYPPQDYLSKLKTFDVGIVSALPTEHTALTLPMKVFEYMSANLAVAASNVSPVRSIVELESCGLVFKSQCSKDVAEVLRRFARDLELAHSLGRNGYRAVFERYNWEMESRKLMRILNSLPLS